MRSLAKVHPACQLAFQHSLRRRAACTKCHRATAVHGFAPAASSLPDSVDVQLVCGLGRVLVHLRAPPSGLGVQCRAPTESGVRPPPEAHLAVVERHLVRVMRGLIKRGDTPMTTSLVPDPRAHRQPARQARVAQAATRPTSSPRLDNYWITRPPTRKAFAQRCSRSRRLGFAATNERVDLAHVQRFDSLPAAVGRLGPYSQGMA